MRKTSDCRFEISDSGESGVQEISRLECVAGQISDLKFQISILNGVVNKAPLGDLWCLRHNPPGHP